jgi:hypothetical protein
MADLALSRYSLNVSASDIPSTTGLEASVHINAPVCCIGLPRYKTKSSSIPKKLWKFARKLKTKVCQSKSSLK